MRVFAILASMAPIFVKAVPSLTQREAVSGPFLGSDDLARCADYVANTGADWLVAAMCAVAKCNQDWILDTTKVVDGTMTDAQSAEVGIYDPLDNLKLKTALIKYADAIASGLDNVGTAWQGGAVDLSVISLAGNWVVKNALISSEEAASTNQTLWEELGVYGLSMLTGYAAIAESVPSTDDDFWELIEAHVNSSPVLILTLSNSDSLSQYYTVSGFASDKSVTLWNPMPVADNASSYETYSVSSLRTRSYKFYHLVDYVAFVE